MFDFLFDRLTFGGFIGGLTTLPTVRGQNHRPTSWDDEERFNLEQAVQIADEGHADIIWTTSHKKSTPIGAIVGGVIGGIAIILLGAGVAFFMYRRKHKRGGAPSSRMTLVDDDGRGHARTVSDLSQKSNGGAIGIGYGYPLLDRSFVNSTPSSQVPLSPTTGTMHTHVHNGSVNSLSFFGSVQHSVAPYGSVAPTSPPATTARALSPVPPSPPAAQTNFAGMNREDIIVPFTLAPSPAGGSSQDANGTGYGFPADRKRADGAIIPVYDSPNSLPTHVTPSEQPVDFGRTTAAATGTRARVNPPAYSAVDEASVISRSVPMHSKKGSGDTQFSIETTTSGPGGIPGSAAPVIQRLGHSAGGGSVSAIDDVIGNMSVGLSPVEETESSGGTLGTGFSGNFVGNQVFRPVIGNPDP
ncbi:hypothetical protein H0H92_008080 [Tricholoma furcatifolium]|nr:hypothetical protein H0H92_008080 [Tricholoma furcatifolium]